MDAESQQHYKYIDGLRALAVLAVVCFHAAIGEATALHRPFPHVEEVGARGVDLFFVLSGFCLALPFLRKASIAQIVEIDYGAFLAKRFARIAPPYYVALVLFSLLAFTPFGYPSTWESVSQLAGAGAREFVPDLAFATSGGPVANASFWTLGVEMRWYVLCPMLIALFVRSRVAFVTLIAALYAAYFVTSGRVPDLGMLPAFMLGIVAASIAVSTWRVTPLAITGAVMLLALATFAQSRTDQDTHADPVWHLACFALVVAARAKPIARLLAWRPIVFVGTASYSIYLIHLPVLCWLGQHGVPWLLAGAIAIASGIAFWAIIERVAVAPAVRDKIATSLQRALGRYRFPPLVVAREGSEAA